MRVLLSLLAVLALFVAPAQAEDFSSYSGERAEPVDHSAIASFLDAYLVPGEGGGSSLVRYAAVTPEDREALKAYVAGLVSIDPTTLGRNEAFAYWANLYNALTLDVVLDGYPVESIRELRSGFRAGPWRRKLVRIGGGELSLDDIEHEILRKHWDEPRVHFAVNCASIGCPDLRQEPFTGEGLDGQLDAAARAYVNSPRGFRRGEGEGRPLVASSIFDWYERDFGGGQEGVLRFARAHADEETAAMLAGTGRIDRYDYDWSLNEAP
jgi:hypothetical protein